MASLSSLLVQPDPVIPGVVRISNEQTFPRPWVAVVGALHGDEPCGVRAIEKIRRDAETGELPLKRGTVILIHGNPFASSTDTRFSEGGADLNRLFDFEFEHRLRREQWSYEHERAIALRPIFETIDAAIDIHSSSAPTPPFVITTKVPTSEQLGHAICLSYVTRGWEDLNILSGKVFLALLSKRGKPSIAVECGQHKEPSSIKVAQKAAMRFLIAQDMIEGEVVTQTEAQLLDVVRVLRKPSPDFRFDRPIRGLELLPKGTKFGSDGDIAVSVSDDRYALLPNDRVEVGLDMLFLARPAN